MAHTEHIITFTAKTWDVTHPLSCPGNLLDCPVTILCREMPRPPKTGRFFGGAVKRGKEWRLELGEECPPEVQGTSRVTRYGFADKKVRPR